MKLSRFILIVTGITFACVVYVQLQVQIFQLAYNGKKKEVDFKELLDRKNTLRYNIVLLESAQNIGSSLLSRDANLQFSDQAQILEIDLPMQLVSSFNKEPQAEKKVKNFLINFFSLKSEAQAKPIK